MRFQGLGWDHAGVQSLPCVLPLPFLPLVWAMLGGDNIPTTEKPKGKSGREKKCQLHNREESYIESYRRKLQKAFENWCGDQVQIICPTMSYKYTAVKFWRTAEKIGHTTT